MSEYLPPVNTALLLLACSVVPRVQGAILSFTPHALAGNSWEVSYTVTNDSLDTPLEDFVVLFDPGRYTNLVTTLTPVDWDALADQPDPLFSDDGRYDALALDTGIAPGASQDGFSVRFDFSGTGQPPAQAYQLVDPFTFTLLEQGVTSPSVVPLPSSLWLFASGLACLVGVKLIDKRQIMTRLDLVI